MAIPLQVVLRIRRGLLHVLGLCSLSKGTLSSSTSANAVARGTKGKRPAVNALKGRQRACTRSLPRLWWRRSCQWWGSNRFLSCEGIWSPAALIRNMSWTTFGTLHSLQLGIPSALRPKVAHRLIVLRRSAEDSGADKVHYTRQAASCTTPDN